MVPSCCHTHNACVESADEAQRKDGRPSADAGHCRMRPELQKRERREQGKNAADKFRSKHWGKSFSANCGIVNKKRR